MAPIASSFISDIIQSLFADLETKLGIESVLYPSPSYMQLKTIRRAGGMPQLDEPDQNCPALWLEYLAGGDKEGALGRAHFGMQEDFNLFAKMVMTPKSVEMLGRDEDDFRVAADASTDMLMRRMWKVVTEWTGAITDPIIGGTTNGARVTTWAYVLTARDTLLVEGRVLLHLVVQVE
jgi:hypothetical protein